MSTAAAFLDVEKAVTVRGTLVWDTIYTNRIFQSVNQAYWLITFQQKIQGYGWRTNVHPSR
jgi:hypothetical protein